MKSLQNAIEDYIALRRSLGFKLDDMAADLTKFASFLEQKAAPYITTALALEWVMQSTDHLPSHWARRLGFVRVFARHWSATDPRTEIPPAGLLPFRAQRARPYLYTEQEIQRLLAAAKSLSPASGLRPWTYHCLFGLLAVSGLRISEAIKLERQDVDFYQGVLTIRPQYVGWPQRPHLPTRRSSNWLAAFGDDRPTSRGCSAGNRCACALPRQGAQAAMHASDQASSKCSEALVPAAQTGRRPNCLSERQRNQAQPGRCAVSVGKACRCCQREVPCVE